ncbi:G-type lectin S-receptor-like serine/threonine-protein kinase SD3-1 [Actinidia eriantha]|uniref:G-type lectin S-receptor-like serine/threonine-protein kinase SD3-1 n=1 Tax=Actinidia eriantha TaxID=165200 RepID=UPI002589983D|nr:G-type lectin S-receptor-like serine/threonine-protein kinase SD3-1 [Actinidia eriantha]XP_057506698.1 G-type lectin S-receptor-like serine/threonine-protein kinase SD3-1 [Actinidia eriantha]
MLGKVRILLLSVGFLLFSVAISEVPLGSKLSVVENNYWTSSNGNFAVGFFNRSDQYSVGIRFNSNSIQLCKQTVVWVAGADLTVGNNSYFRLTQNGELVLFDSTRGVVAWTSKTSNSSVDSAALLDSGSLVLLNNKREIVWQSFDTPTDTLLPSQNLSVTQTLRAASRNSVSSYYSLHLEGQLQLRWENNVAYWTSTSPSQSISRAILGSDGILQLLDQRSKVVWSVFGDDHNDSDVKLRFLRLDVDGNLRLYSWIDALRSWRPVWQAIENQCDVFATCGLCGICVFNESGSPLCRCPFKPTFDSNLKCLVRYGNDCKSGSLMTAYEHTFLYGIYPPNETITLASLQQCKSLCQENPLCAAVSYTNDGTAQCRIMKTSYITGQSYPSLRSISFVKKCSDPIAALPISPASSSSSPHRLCIPCIVGVGSGTFVLFFLIQFGIGFYVYKKRNYNFRKAALAFTSPYSNVLISLSFSEIRELTGSFKHEIGPNMFKGTLPSNRRVIVKDLKEAIEGRKFQRTVLKIGSIYHRNLVHLEGYCCESDHRFLVYEFAENGSLATCMADPKLWKRLTWGKRVEICLTVARAIAYLHTGCREFISHGNLKCENVVLDENFEAKVSEFGLERVHAENDVKDFGVMVVELVSGCREGDDFCKWAYEMWVKGESEKVIDGRIEGGIKIEQLEKVLRIAFWCLQVDEQMRPSMGEVINVLEGTSAVDPPPPPFIRRRPQQEEESSESD